MDIQKVASVTTATAVLGTGAFVGGNHQIDNMQGGSAIKAAEKLRDVGYVVEKISLPEKIESISATEIRNKNDK